MQRAFRNIDGLCCFTDHASQEEGRGRGRERVAGCRSESTPSVFSSRFSAATGDFDHPRHATAVHTHTLALSQASTRRHASPACLTLHASRVWLTLHADLVC